MTEAAKQIDEIDQKIKELQEERKAIVEKDKAGALKTIKELMAKFEITLEDLGDEKRKKRITKANTKAINKVTIKAGRTFKKGEETWTSGHRGKRPNWVSEAIENKTLDSLEVKK